MVFVTTESCQGTRGTRTITARQRYASESELTVTGTKRVGRYDIVGVTTTSRRETRGTSNYVLVTRWPSLVKDG